MALGLRLMAAIWLALAIVKPAGALESLAGGGIESVAPDTGEKALVTGWACARADKIPLAIELYAALPYPAGQLITRANVDRPTSAAATHCAQRDAARFTIVLPPTKLFRYAGLPLFAYAVSADGNRPSELSNSGRFDLPEYSPVAAAPRRCEISDIGSLKGCFAKPAAYDQFTVVRDLTCSSEGECCGDHGRPLIRLVNIGNKLIDGGGHILRRATPLACNAVEFDNARRVLLKDFSIDENERVAPCELAAHKCPNSIFVNNSADVRLDSVHLYFGKGVALRVWHTDGFVFVHSSISGAGIIGLSVGHFQYGSSQNVVIADSVVARSRTNGIALVGADASEPADPVLIIANVLNANHWHGLWPRPGVAGGTTSGGQLLLADGENIRVSGNVESGGICEQCKPLQPVTAIEISNHPQPPGGVRGLAIDHNTFLNGAGVAIYQNAGMFAADISLTRNLADGYRYMDGIKARAVRVDNVMTHSRAALVRRGAATYEILQLVAGGVHYAAIARAEHPGAKLVGVFVLSPSPRPGAPWRPLLRCDAGAQQTVVADGKCAGQERVDAVFGYSLAATDPGAKPFFACAASATDRFLSWDATCEHKKRVGQLGYAIPAATPETIPASIAAPSPGAQP